MLKGAIFSLHDVLVKQGTIDRTLFGETIKLLRYLKGRGVEPVFISNHDWTASSSGTHKPFRSVLERSLARLTTSVAGTACPSSLGQTPRITSFSRRGGLSAKSSMSATRKMT